MFTFHLIGKITSLNLSRDGKVGYAKMLCDPVAGLDLREKEEPDLIDLQYESSMMPAGTGLGTRLQIEGTGAITAVEWIDHKQVPPKSKIINNTRMQARSIKLAK